MVVLALQLEVTPTDPKRAAVNIGAPRRQRASADKLVKIDPQLGLVCERQCGAAYPGVPFAFTFGWNAIWPENSVWKFQFSS